MGLSLVHSIESWMWRVRMELNRERERESEREREREREREMDREWDWKHLLHSLRFDIYLCSRQRSAGDHRHSVCCAHRLWDVALLPYSLPTLLRSLNRFYSSITSLVPVSVRCRSVARRTAQACPTIHLRSFRLKPAPEPESFLILWTWNGLM